MNTDSTRCFNNPFENRNDVVFHPCSNCSFSSHPFQVQSIAKIFVHDSHRLTDIIYDKIIVDNDYIKYPSFSASSRYSKKKKRNMITISGLTTLFEEIFCQKIDSPMYDFLLK